MKIETAKELYERLNSFKRDGPLPIFTSRRKNNRLVKRISDLLRASIRKKTDGTIFFPSPWHAALFLDFLNIRTVVPKVNSESVSRDFHGAVLNFENPLVRFVYRGQRDGRYTILSSIKREGVDTAKERLAARFLGLIMNELTRPLLADWEVSALPPEVFVSTAQHYGIRTNLVDFTTDPSVAVYFANGENPARKSDYPEEATVFSLPLFGGKRLDSLRVILPPPSTKRLYLQRGVFIECDGKLTDVCQRLCFKPHPEFQLIREGHRLDVYPDDKMLEKIVGYAKSKANACGTQLELTQEQESIFRQEAFLELEEHLRFPSRATLDGFEEMHNWHYGIVDSLNWLAGVLSPEAQKLCLEHRLLKLVCKANPELINWSISYLKIQETTPFLDDETRQQNTHARENFERIMAELEAESGD